MNISKSPMSGLSPVVSQVRVDDMGVTSMLSRKGAVINVDHVIDEDEAKILALGYKQELKREFSLWSLFSVSFSVLGLLPSIGACFDYQQLVIGITPLPWLIAMIFITAVALSMAELASKFPVSSGTPYFVGMLSPPFAKAYLVWFTSWANWLCQITAAPSVSYSCASMMLALYSFTSEYIPTNGHVFALSTGVLVASGVLCVLPSKWAARINTAGMVCNVLFLAIVFVMMLAANKRVEINGGGISKFNSSSIAWSITNQTDWPTGIAFLQSWLGVIWAMSGYDSPMHLAEECSNASVAVPKAICLVAVCGGAMGFFYLIAIAYLCVSIDEINADPQGLGQPFVTYLSQVLDHRMVIAATALTTISSFFMAQSCLLASSRVTYAYSRDRLFPFSNLWKRVSPWTQTPILAVILNVVIGTLLLLLCFAGEVAISAVFSIGALSGFLSFTVPILLKVTYAQKTFEPGPWHLGKFSQPIGWIAVAFVALMIPILCFPYVKGSELTPENMNWTSLIFGGPMLIFTIYFFVEAKKWYIGPLSNIDEADITYEVNEHGDVEEKDHIIPVYEGKEGSQEESNSSISNKRSKDI
ncbi:uncharacterized protein LODBEIA_P26400 [Lodderomyces beijingensis]|uniref:Uncharacterized protein n=1 Tax=Lodderomyces beijingensis TaxID=1775926 RepID=A0ABP0ZND1_9ASCO